MSDTSNVHTLPARAGASRGPVETLVDALKSAERGEVADVLIVTRDANGYLDIEWSSMGVGDVCEMSVYLAQHATEIVDAMNQLPQRRPAKE